MSIAELHTSREIARDVCAHCEQPLPNGSTDVYCCRGCKTVAALLRTASLERYYDLRGGPGMPVAVTDDAPRDRKWMEPIVARTSASESPTSVSLDLQGIHCSACVWLVETVFTRNGSGQIEVNPALGRAHLVVDSSFPLESFVRDVESFGYRVGPASDEDQAPASDALLVRAGIALALAGNAMMLSAAIHLGLREGVVYEWANDLSFGASVLAMLIGAPIFVRSAWAGLRRGLLHLDLPIALGMLIAFLGSVWSYATRGGANYTDTLTAFVALMLLGRWLQTRILERNRQQMLRDPGVAGLMCRKLREDGRTELSACVDISEGDVLLVAPGDLVPVRSTLIDADAAFSFDWIDGESHPRLTAVGAEVPSGALLASDSAVRVRTTEPFQSSTVSSLLAAPRADDQDGRTLAGLPTQVGGFYVVFVLLASAVSGALAYLRTNDVVSTLEVTTAALVVTCPCAFGIAVPLAYELVQTRLRHSGVFVRRPSLFERALRIERVVFDKTGTLTTGRLGLEDSSLLDGLSASELVALSTLANRSNHPKSRAIALALEDRFEAKSQLEANVREVRGRGLELYAGDSLHRLGEARFSIDDEREGERVAESGVDVVYSIDGVARALFTTIEQLRPEAKEELARLRDSGIAVALLSGDGEARCAEIAKTLDIPSNAVFASKTPEDKERFILESAPATTLMIGDGLNDARALSAAGCSGTPSIDRPFTASRCDFYFVTPGLEPVREVLEASRRLASIVRTDLAIAFVYNVFAVALCIAGVMRPWLAALLMPGSSLFTILFTIWFLTSGARRWKS